MFEHLLRIPIFICLTGYGTLTWINPLFYISLGLPVYFFMVFGWTAPPEPKKPVQQQQVVHLQQVVVHHIAQPVPAPAAPTPPKKEAKRERISEEEVNQD